MKSINLKELQLEWESTNRGLKIWFGRTLVCFWRNFPNYNQSFQFVLSESNSDESYSVPSWSDNADYPPCRWLTLLPLVKRFKNFPTDVRIFFLIFVQLKAQKANYLDKTPSKMIRAIGALRNCKLEKSWSGRCSMRKRIIARDVSLMWSYLSTEHLLWSLMTIHI